MGHHGWKRRRSSWWAAVCGTVSGALRIHQGSWYLKCMLLLEEVAQKRDMEEINALIPLIYVSIMTCLNA